MTKRPLELDMCAGSQLRDTQGETLGVEGADIGEMEAGRGRLNDNHGKGFFNCIGKVTLAKKIFTAKDCDDDRQRYYWEKVKSPYIYVKGELFDDEDHPNAKAAAAILRNIHKTDCPLKVKASVEGGVLARGTKDETFLARTKVHSVALTFVPANQATLVEPLNLEKSNDIEADMELIKSVMHLAQTSVPSFRQITRDAQASKIENNFNAILEMMGEDGVELKKQLIEESLEAKIAENVEKIHALIKGWPKNEAENLANLQADSVVHDHLNEHGQEHVDPKEYTPHYLSDAGYNDTTQAAINDADFESDREIQDIPEGDPVPRPRYREWNSDSDSPHSPRSKRDVQGRTASIANWHDGNGKSRGIYVHIHPGFGTDLPVTNLTRQVRIGQVSNFQEGQDLVDRAVAHQKHGGTLDKDWASCPHCQPVPKTPPTELEHQQQFNLGPRASETQEQHGAKFQKALTAGYGGAGSPMSLTGGGVMQSESFAQPKFRYITCNSCGKEQVYGKFQVKCRDCGKAFSMAELEKFFRKG